MHAKPAKEHAKFAPAPSLKAVPAPSSTPGKAAGNRRGEQRTDQSCWYRAMFVINNHNWTLLRRCFHIVAILGITAESGSAITWGQAQRKDADWLRSIEGRRVIENVLLYQSTSGGWPKNIDMADPLSEAAKRRLAARRAEPGTIDNGATYTQLRFLARAFSATRDERVRAAFEKGLDYLFEAQYDNGGWPIYFPLRGGYENHIHFNDNSVSGVLMLMDDVAKSDKPFNFVDAERRTRAAAAFDKAINCILKCQVVVDGRRTAWCAQHDERTLTPAAARNFEPVSLSGHESVGLVRCLMRVDKPSTEIIAAVRDAVAWLDSVKIEGIRVVKIDTPDGDDLAVKEDPAGPAIWARFYEIGTNRPIFTGRDKIVRYRYDQIERERRTNYAYYGDWPRKLIDKDYPAWAAQCKIADSE
jgi:PelA/Pel-15E family pectate lyase